MNSQTRPPEDKILLSFLEQQQADAAALAAASDLVRLTPSNETPPRHYVAEFFCKGLVRGPDGGIREAGHFAVGIWFTPDYLRRVEPAAASWVWCFPSWTATSWPRVIQATPDAT